MVILVKRNCSPILWYFKIYFLSNKLAEVSTLRVLSSSGDVLPCYDQLKTTLTPKKQSCIDI